jgi:uncharacterized surface protein with fasciclin (FAS1) repeats
MDSIVHNGSDSVVFLFSDTIFYPQKTSSIDRVTIASPVDNNLYDAISSDTAFSQFTTGIDEGLLNPYPYASSGDITAFTPENSVFRDYDIDLSTLGADLANYVLSYHTLNGRYRAEDFEDGENIKYYTTNFPADSVFVTKGINPNTNNIFVYVNGVQVTAANLEASNGVAHTVGDLLFPPGQNIYAEINRPDRGYDSIARLVARAAEFNSKIIDTLQNEVLTLLVPSNKAFETFLSDSQIGSIDNIATDKAYNLLRDHMVINRKFFINLILAGSSGGSLSFGGGSIRVAAAPDDVTSPTGAVIFLNPSAAVILDSFDFFQRNGVIHKIGGILTK